MNSRDDARLVWRLFSPTSRQVSCQVRRVNGHFVLAVADEQQEIVTAQALELELLHAKAAAWRNALEARGYVPDGRSVSGPRTPSSEPRAAFRGLIESAELLGLTDREAAVALRDCAMTGLVGIGLHDAAMIRDAIAQSRQALSQVSRTGIEPLLNSCETLLSRVEVILAGNQRSM
jgi:hypothetical protein